MSVTGIRNTDTQIFMGHHKSLIWIGLLLVVFTPISQEFGSRNTQSLPSNSSEQTLAKKVEFEEKFLAKQAGKPRHRGSGRRGRQFLA